MNGDEPRLVLTGGSGASVVLAEADAPGSLHYLLEAEGFQVVGCASNEDELGRVLGQGVRPDVIVLDADVVATSSLVARQLAPEAHVIAVWPEAVQPPPGGERVDPRMVYEELGPAIRRHMDRQRVPVPVIAMPVEEPVMAGVAAAAAVPMASGSVVARVASRVSVLSATLITAIVLTMGVSFALGGFRWHPSASDGSPRVFAPRSSDAGSVDTSDPLNGRAPSGVGNGDPGGKPTDHSGGSNDHHGTGGIVSVVATTTGGSGDTGSTPGDQTGGSGDQTGGSGDQGSGQGDQGGGQGDQGGGQGDQGGGQGDQGGGDHGGGGDQGGDHGGGGQGDQGGDGQHGGGDGQGDQDGDSQGEDEQGDGQGDQGGDSQGEDSHGDHGDGHGAHSDEQNSDNQN
jgi:hypothetical protein